MPLDRDLDVNPYSADERRVVEWMHNRTHDIGGGDDPVGFLLASYEMIWDQLQEARSYLRDWPS